MKIEKVSWEDAEEILDIYSYYVENTAISFEYVTPSLDEFRERIKTISDKYPYLKAVDNGRIVGYAYASTYKGRKAYDWSVEVTVYVQKDCRQSGIGRSLYEALEQSLKAMGILNMNACIARPQTQDIHLTDGSYEFHSKMGFELVGTFHNSGYKFDTWYDMIWMEKMIGEHTAGQRPVQFG